MDGRLSSAQMSLSLQDEAMHQNDREHRQMLDRLTAMERTIGCIEADKRQLQVRHYLLIYLVSPFVIIRLNYESDVFFNAFSSIAG